MKILVTVAAGLIGFHTSKLLLERGDVVVWLDILNEYYDVKLKHARLGILTPYARFKFMKLDLDDRKQVGTGEHDQARPGERQDAAVLVARMAVELGAAAGAAGHLARLQGRTAEDRIAARANHGFGYFRHGAVP